MKHRLTLLIFLASAIAFSATAQTQPAQSVSLRLGVPLGLTYKTYVTKRAAIEFGLGAAGPAWGKHYYINAFNNIPKYENFKYLDHQVRSTLYLQARYLKDFSIPTTGMEGQLGWYCGAGLVAKISQVKYTYTNTNAVPPTQTDRRTDVDFGPEAILGAEYWLEDTPFSFYGEGSLMLEIFDRVTGRGFAAIGVRYHFMQ
ncbi:MAG TPA: hypothetical protein VFE50_02230 [Cyclobacteriaceae bacterium]|nr:hypothetical protein [Cyclobacteriaceae bacterium]